MHNYVILLNRLRNELIKKVRTWFFLDFTLQYLDFNDFFLNESWALLMSHIVKVKLSNDIFWCDDFQCNLKRQCHAKTESTIPQIN